MTDRLDALAMAAARRCLDRVERDQCLHLDSLASEIADVLRADAAAVRRRSPLSMANIDRQQWEDLLNLDTGKIDRVPVAGSMGVGEHLTPGEYFERGQKMMRDWVVGDLALAASLSPHDAAVKRRLEAHAGIDLATCPDRTTRSSSKYSRSGSKTNEV